MRAFTKYSSLPVVVRSLSPPVTDKFSRFILLTVHMNYNCLNYTLHCWVRPHRLCLCTQDQVGDVYEVKSSGDDGYVDERPVWRLFQKKRENELMKIKNMS